MQKRILVTGAAGFIGFHTARALSKRGDLVFGLDNFNAYYPPELKQARAQELLKNDVEIMVGDITDKVALNALVNKERITHIVHLAAQAGVRYSKENPLAYFTSNMEGFFTILETVRAYPHIKLVFASSSSVYGCNEKLPFSIHDPAMRPASFYAATKKSNELMAHSYSHIYGIHATALRFFTVYGPWGRPDMAYYLFANAIAKGKPIRLYNNGMMRRDFTYIDDAVQGTLAALDNVQNYHVFNIGNNHPEELLTLVSLLEAALEKKALIELESTIPSGDVEATFADIESSKEELGFMPTTSLREGIAQFAHWYKTFV